MALKVHTLTAEEALKNVAAARKNERPHPPTISKLPGNKKRSPAASDMFEAHRPDPRPYLYLSLFWAFSVSASLS